MADPIRSASIRRIALVWLVALLALAGFLTVGVKGSLEFAMMLRVPTAIAMLITAFAQGVATVIFHTVTANRILTPSIMGFDALYVLMQTLVVTIAGGAALQAIDGPAGLIAQTLVMVLFATLLYRWLFSSTSGLYLTLLVGVVFGIVFRTVSTFLERLLHPADYDLLSVKLFGRITNVDASLLPITLAICAVCGVIVWRKIHVLDAMSLGRELSTSIGVDHRRELTVALMIVAALVAMSTALAGPMTFFGFLVATLAYQISPTSKHAVTLPLAVGLGVIALAGGQLIMQHVFYAAGYLTVIIEFVGGIVFLATLANRRSL